jgi:hypothetical protein
VCMLDSLWNDYSRLVARGQASDARGGLNPLVRVRVGGGSAERSAGQNLYPTPTPIRLSLNIPWNSVIKYAVKLMWFPR